MLKKTNKKGFTLIELIIVIAIMAILIALLAPQLIKYIEKSKVGKDENSLDSVRLAVEAEMMDEKLSKYSTGVSDGKILGKALGDLNADSASDLEKALYAALFSGENPVLAAKFTADDVFSSNACEGGEVYIFVKANGGVAVAAVTDGEICDYNGDLIFVSSTLAETDVVVA